jgi:hypothetical protein
LQQWGFKCGCPHCSLSPALTSISDNRLALIASLEAELVDISSNRTATTETAELLVDLYLQENLDGAVAEAYMYAALEYSYKGDKRMAQKWAAKAVEALVLYRGEHHLYYQAMTRLLLNPEAHDSWRYVIDGKTGGLKDMPGSEKNQIVVSGGD